MKQILSILLIAGLSFGAWSYFSDNKSQQIVVPTQQEDERATIEELIYQYYKALREENYKHAASFYEAGAFEAMGMNPESALKAASKLTGVPQSVKIEALRINGNTAAGEIVIDRQGAGSVQIELWKDEERLGTWAKTLNFTKKNGSWKIAADSTQTWAQEDTQLKRTLDILGDIEDQKL